MKRLLCLGSALVFILIPFSGRLSAQERPWMKHIAPSAYFQSGFTTDNSLDNSFYIRRVRVSLGGTLCENADSGKLEYKLQAELAGSPKIVDCFFKYTICDEFGIQLGQYKTPLSIENSEVTPLKLEMIDYSLLVQRFCRMSATDLSGISSAGREIGLQFFGKALKMPDGHHLLQYNAAIFNGNGINKMDDDCRKDLSLRLIVCPVRGLGIAAYYLRTIGPHPDTVPVGGYDWHVYDRYGGGIAYDSDFAWFRAEYMTGHTFGSRGEGAYGTIGYKFNKAFSAGFRYDYFNSDSREAGHVQQHYTAAANWYPFSGLRLQINYTYRQEPGAGPLHAVSLLTSIIL